MRVYRTFGIFLAHVCAVRADSNSRHDQVTAKANALQAPMSTLSKEIKISIAKTLVPVAKTLQDAHRLAKTRLDPGFEKGMLDFNDACQGVEKSAREDLSKLSQMFKETQASCSAAPKSFLYLGYDRKYEEA